MYHSYAVTVPKMCLPLSWHIPFVMNKFKVNKNNFRRRNSVIFIFAFFFIVVSSRRKLCSIVAVLSLKVKHSLKLLCETGKET